MWRDIFRNLFLMGAVATLLAGRAGSAFAAEIQDSAGFFSQKALDKANTQLGDLKKTTGKDVRIETFKGVPSRKADEVEKMSRNERARFFESWARERATSEHVRGIYILITKHPGHVQVEEDRTTREQGFGTAERNELRDKLLKGFREKDYDKALLDSVDYVQRTLKSKLKMHAEAESVPVTGQHHGAGRDHRGLDTPQQPAPQQTARGMGWLGWVVVAIVVFLAFRLIGALMGGGMGGGGGGYGGGYGPGGGGGMLGGLMTGLLGAVAGNWLYHSFFDSSAHAGESGFSGGGNDQGDHTDGGSGQDFEGSGGDFDDQDGGGGGDFGDSGSGDSGGGDFGGGDFGGGDFGGGGDF